MSLTYRGTSSDDVHFNVTERRVYNAPAFDVTGIEVPGRSGDILNSQERFKNKSIVYTGFIRSSDFPGDTTWERLSRGLRTIKAWVCGDAGKYHDLTDDYDPGFVRRAFVSGETAISEVLDRPDGATITITFMAEPFMYEESDPIELPETDTASGAIASFEGVAAPLQSLKFSIEPQQSGSGDPSPTNIRPISGWSQVDTVAAGKNLIDVTFSTVNASNIITNTFSLKAGTYTLSMKYNGTPTYGVYIRNGSTIQATSVAYWYNATTQTFTLDKDYDTLCISIYYGNGITPSEVSEVMIVQGSTASPYAAPALTPIAIALGQTVYGGTVDALNGKLVIDSFLYVYDGTETNWNKSSSALNGFYNNLYTQTVHGYPNMADYNSIGMFTNEASSMFRLTKNAAEYKTNYGVCYLDSGMNFDCDPNVFGTTITTFKAKLAELYANGTPLTVCAKMKTPIEVDLTPVSVNSLLGQNNIWCNTGETEVVYVEPTENPTEWPSKPRLEITMAGAGALTVNGKTWSIGAYTGTLICDSEIMDWYDASNLKNSLVSGDGFPELQPGPNIITYTGGITKVVAKPRWRTL